MGNDLKRTLPADKLEELCKLTAFTQDEIKDWNTQFYKRCPSGNMTKEDFRVMYAQLFPQGDASDFADRVFPAYDQDRNGYIDFREFLISINVSSRGNIDDKLRWMFSIYDADNDGFVTEDEIREMCMAMFKLKGSTGVKNLSPSEVAAEIFRGLDHNDDKRLCSMEFVIGSKSSPMMLSVLSQFSQPDVD